MCNVHGTFETKPTNSKDQNMAENILIQTGMHFVVINQLLRISIKFYWQWDRQILQELLFRNVGS